MPLLKGKKNRRKNFHELRRGKTFARMGRKTRAGGRPASGKLQIGCTTNSAVGDGADGRGRTLDRFGRGGSQALGGAGGQACE